MVADEDLCLSVVIPSFNTADLTLQCLATLLREAPSGSEVIVVDDNSGDDTVMRVRDQFPQVEVLCHDHSQGFTAAANSGLARAHGDVLLLLNSDTEIPAGGLDVLLPTFAREARLGIAGAELTFPDGRSQWGGGEAPGLLWLLMLSSGLPTILNRLPGYRRLRPLAAESRKVEWVTGAALAIRRQTWQESGALDPSYRFYCQDLDLCLRVAALGWEVRQIPDFQVIHYLGSSIGKEQTTTQQSGAPELLWSDLLLWARIHRGEVWAERAARIMKVGGTLRVITRSLMTPIVQSARRSVWRKETRAFRAALAAI
jgi:GT2 family glycosyltransferase